MAAVAKQLGGVWRPLTRSGRSAAIGASCVLGLPVLLIASLVLEAPLAAPAAIALGYAAAARCAARGQTRGAAAWSIGVLAGLLGWTLIFFARSGDLSAPELAAVLSAPLFALAPLMIGIGGRDPDALRRKVLGSVDCLDALAPGEAKVFVDGTGTILAGTRAGLAALRIPASEVSLPVIDAVAVADRPALIEAIAVCAGGGGPVEHAVHLLNPRNDDRAILSFAPIEPRAVAITVRRIEADRPQAYRSVETFRNEPPRAGPSCNVAEAIRFAVRKVARKADAAGLIIAFDKVAETHVRCEIALCQRILTLVLDTAVATGAAQGTIAIAARPVRGAVLVRVNCPTGEDGAARLFDGAVRRSALYELVDAAGGSLLIDARDGGVAISLRLERTAPDAMEPERVELRRRVRG